MEETCRCHRRFFIFVRACWSSADAARFVLSRRIKKREEIQTKNKQKIAHDPLPAFERTPRRGYGLADGYGSIGCGQARICWLCASR